MLKFFMIAVIAAAVYFGVVNVSFSHEPITEPIKTKLNDGKEYLLNKVDDTKDKIKDTMLESL